MSLQLKDLSYPGPAEGEWLSLIFVMAHTRSSAPLRAFSSLQGQQVREERKSLKFPISGSYLSTRATVQELTGSSVTDPPWRRPARPAAISIRILLVTSVTSSLGNIL